MLQLDRADVPVSLLLSSAAQSVSVKSKEKNILVKAENTSMIVQADENRVIQILINLLTNAIKFSPNQSTITLSARELGGLAEITVQDEGRGIPAENCTAVTFMWKANPVKAARSNSHCHWRTWLKLQIARTVSRWASSIIRLAEV